MAEAMFLNASPFSIAVNLNGSEINSPVEPMSRPSSELTLYSAPYSIQAYKRADVFGASAEGNVVDNLLIIFSPDRGLPQIWHLRSEVSVLLGLFFYLLDDLITAVDQTGNSKGITIKRGTIDELQQFMQRFSAVRRPFPTLP